MRLANASWIATAAISGLSLALATSAMAGGEHKHDHDHDKEKAASLPAHEHGRGKLRMAVSGKTVVIEFEAPAADIVGFEHAAKTKKQKAAVKSAQSTLEKPLELFTLSAAAGCNVAKVNVESGQNATGKAHKEAGHSHGHDHDKEKSAKAEEGDVHSEWHAQYELTCSKPSSLGEVTFTYFDTFSNAEALEVSLIGDRGTKQFEATRKKRRMSMPAAS